MLIILIQFGPPDLDYDGRWYWEYNSGLDNQTVRTFHFHIDLARLTSPDPEQVSIALAIAHFPTSPK
jgi:hypothetical protein